MIIEGSTLYRGEVKDGRKHGFGVESKEVKEKETEIFGWFKDDTMTDKFPDDECAKF